MAFVENNLNGSRQREKKNDNFHFHLQCNCYKIGGKDYYVI